MAKGSGGTGRGGAGATYSIAGGRTLILPSGRSAPFNHGFEQAASYLRHGNNKRTRAVALGFIEIVRRGNQAIGEYSAAQNAALYAAGVRAAVRQASRG